MKPFFLFLFLITCIYSIHAQEPTLLSIQGYGGDQGEGVSTHVTGTEDGGFIIEIGTVSDVGTGNIDSLCAITRERSIFIKYNSDATVMEWIKCYGNGGDSTFEYIFPTNDSGVVLGGEYNSNVGEGFLIWKEDALGNIVWSHGYSEGMGADIRDMIAANDGGYILVGNVYYTDTNFTVHNSGSMNADIGVLKVDSLGNKQWSEAIGGSYDDEALTVIPSPSDGYYILGSTNSGDYDCTGLHGVSGGPDPDAYLVRLDNNGNILWHNDLGGSGVDGDYGWGIADGKGGVLLACSSNSTDGDVHHNTTGNIDYWALEVDSSNNILWDNCYGSSAGNNVIPYTVCKATDGSVWITGLSDVQGGEVDTAYGGGDAWVVHADSAGNFLGGKVIGGTEEDEGTMVYPLPGGAVITGGFYSGLGGNAPLTYYGQTDAFIAILSPWATGIKNIANENTITIYPNPASQNLNIQLQQITGNTICVTVIDEIGIVTYHDTFDGLFATIDVSKWHKGIYLVQMSSGDGYRITKKVLVE